MCLFFLQPDGEALGSWYSWSEIRNIWPDTHMTNEGLTRPRLSCSLLIGPETAACWHLGFISTLISLDTTPTHVLTAENNLHVQWGMETITQILSLTLSRTADLRTNSVTFQGAWQERGGRQGWRWWTSSPTWNCPPHTNQMPNYHKQGVLAMSCRQV